MTDRILTTGDRHVSVETAGDPSGLSVFLLHGTPGSRLGPRPRSMLLYQLGIHLISFDRPGYGGSDRFPGRCVADVAEDVAAIADAYGLGRFAVVGRSGGGPHAMACAALLPDRITRAAVLVSLAPREAEGLDWFRGMSDSNVTEFMAATSGRHRISARLTAAADTIRGDPASLLAKLQREVPECDLPIIADAGIRTMLARNHAEGLRLSAHGWIDDVVALCTPWGFDLSAITAPVFLWHGEEDIFSPASHTKWIADQLPHATVIIQPSAAHFGALAILVNVLLWLTT